MDSLVFTDCMTGPVALTEALGMAGSLRQFCGCNEYEDGGVGTAVKIAATLTAYQALGVG